MKLKELVVESDFEEIWLPAGLIESYGDETENSVKNNYTLLSVKTDIMDDNTQPMLATYADRNK